MIDKEVLEKDPNIYISPDELEVLYSKNPPQSYRIIDIKVGNIRRAVNGHIGTLYDTVNYQFVNNPTDCKVVEQYKEYCKDPYNLVDNDRSINKYSDLISKFENEEYSIKKGAIIINQYNFILDGLHRSCILLSKYGPDHKVRVVKLYKKTQRRMMILSPWFEFKQFCKKLLKIH